MVLFGETQVILSCMGICPTFFWTPSSILEEIEWHISHISRKSLAFLASISHINMSFSSQKTGIIWDVFNYCAATVEKAKVVLPAHSEHSAWATFASCRANHSMSSHPLLNICLGPQLMNRLNRLNSILNVEFYYCTILRFFLTLGRRDC